MTALEVYAILKKKLLGVTTGISHAYYDAPSQKIVFVCNDGTEIRLTMPSPLTNREIEMINKMDFETEYEPDGVTVKDEYLTFNGARIGSTMVTDFTVTNPVGMEKMNDYILEEEVVEVVKKMLTNDTPPTISASPNPSSSVIYEWGIPYTFTITIKGKQGTYVLSNITETCNPTGLIPGRTITCTGMTVYNGTEVITIDEQVTLSYTIKDINNRTGSASTTLIFRHPCYTGIVGAEDDETTITADDILAGTKVLMDKTTKTFTYNSGTTFAKFFFAYPTDKYFNSTIKKVLDVNNGFDVTTGCRTMTVPILCADGQLITYNVIFAGTYARYADFKVQYSW